MFRWSMRLALTGALIALALTLHLETPWEMALSWQVTAAAVGYGIGIHMRSRSHPYLRGSLPLGGLLLLSWWLAASLELSARLALMLGTGYGYAAGLVLEGRHWRREYQT